MGRAFCPHCEEPIQTYAGDVVLECPRCGERFEVARSRKKKKRGQSGSKAAGSREWTQELWRTVFVFTTVTVVCLIICIFAGEHAAPLVYLWFLFHLAYTVKLASDTRFDEMEYQGGNGTFPPTPAYLFIRPQLLILLIVGLVGGFFTYRLEMAPKEARIAERERKKQEEAEKWRRIAEENERRKPKQPPFTPAKAPPSATEIPGLIAYWPLDEGQGESAKDASGNDITATLYGPKWVPGIRGNALSFNGTADSVDLGSSKKLNFAEGSAFAVAGWVKTKEQLGTLLAFRNENEQCAIVQVFLAHGKLAAWTRHDNINTAPNGASSKWPVNNDQWRHFAVVRLANGTTNLYLDGDLVGELKHNSYAKPGWSITTDLRWLGVEPMWRKLKANSPDSRFLQGALDEICVFNRALSPEEIKKLAGR